MSPEVLCLAGTRGVETDWKTSVTDHAPGALGVANKTPGGSRCHK